MSYKGPIQGRCLIFIEDYSTKQSFLEERNVCCDELNFHINEKERVILYILKYREYAIRARVEEDDMGNLSGIIQTIKYCPFCSSNLPTSLREQWFETLEELGFDDPNNQEIPDEFTTDEWWKKRGL